MEPMPKFDHEAYIARIRQQMEAMLGQVADAIMAHPMGRSSRAARPRSATCSAPASRRSRSDCRDGLLNYVCEHRDRIRNPEFNKNGWQIGIGPTESCCKTLTQRLKGAGMRWDADNAEAIMALEALRESGLWKTCWQTLLPQKT